MQTSDNLILEYRQIFGSLADDGIGDQICFNLEEGGVSLPAFCILGKGHLKLLLILFVVLIFVLEDLDGLNVRN